jgi:hypothetical protein
MLMEAKTKQQGVKGESRAFVYRSFFLAVSQAGNESAMKASWVR